LLFCGVNLALHAGFDAETLLRRSLGKFERRFNRMEDLASALGTPLGECDAKAQDSLWRAAKDVDIPAAGNASHLCRGWIFHRTPRPRWLSCDQKRISVRFPAFEFRPFHRINPPMNIILLGPPG